MTDSMNDNGLIMDDSANQDSELISMVVHDLKSPVSAARGFMELIEQTGPLTPQQKHFINRAFTALSRMDRLITSLLDFTQIESGLVLELKKINIVDVVDEALDLYMDIAGHENIVVNIDMPESGVICEVDERLISHVINNLLSNAIKYNREGGQVWVTVSEVDENLKVSVRDSGIGIPTASLPRVFERFYRAHKDHENKADGSGLGLAITKSIIELHHGRIWVESEQAVGTEFVFTMPKRQSLQ